MQSETPSLGTEWMLLGEAVRRVASILSVDIDTAVELIRTFSTGREVRIHADRFFRKFRDENNMVDEGTEVDCVLPWTFWIKLASNPSFKECLNWRESNFSGGEEFVSSEGYELYRLFELDSLKIAIDDLAVLVPQTRPRQAGNVGLADKKLQPGGRRPANWWPVFAEELALHMHEQGTPAGQGREGQTDMIDAILDRMAQRGIDETPSRSAMQPVINAILDRMRAPDK